MDKPQIIGHHSKSLNCTLFDCRWIPVSTKFIVIGSNPRGTGSIQVFDVTASDLNLLAQSEKSSSFKCCTFGASRLPSRHLATGAFDGRMAIWDIGNENRLDMPVYGVQAHKEIINSIDGVGGLSIGAGAPEIATGSRDGTVKVWDPRQAKRPVATMEPGDAEGNTGNISNCRRDCWTVAFGHAYNDHDRCLAAGYDNGDVKLFDLKAMRVRWETNLNNGVCCLEFDRKDIAMNKLVATTLEGKFHVFDMRTQHPKKGFASLTETVQGGTVWQVKHLPQQRDVFMTMCGNGSLHLWQYHYPSKRQKIVREANPVEGQGDIEVAQGIIGTVSQLQNVTLSNQPISSLDWCPDKLGLAVCVAFDQTLRLLIVTKLNKL